MTSLSSTLFLALFITFSLGLYLISKILDSIKLPAAQKLMILKTGLLFLMLAPFLFLALKAVTYGSIQVTMPNLYIDTSSEISQSLTPIHQKIYWPFYVSLFYGIGVFVVTVNLIKNYFVTKKWLSNSTTRVLQGQTVRLSSRISSPLSFGFFYTEIYFPMIATEKWTAREIQLALSHEQNHIQQHDPLLKLISLFVRALLFFAPWMYVLHRKLELEMEILCDENTCVQTQARIEEYGSFLLALVCQEQPKTLLVTNITDSTLKRRIIAMKSRKIQRPVFTALFSACLLLVGTTAIATSSGITEKKTVYKISSVLSVNGKVLSRPRLAVIAEEKASITQTDKDGSSELKMEMITTDVSMPNLENGIGINFDIQYRLGNTNGHANPQVILAPNKEGTITIAGEDGQVFEMRIKAEREF